MGYANMGADGLEQRHGLVAGVDFRANRTGVEHRRWV